MDRAAILFVEDNSVFAFWNAEFLRECGFRVINAEGAPDALRVIDGAEPIAALVTDIHLGPGQDGFEVARRARAAYPELPVVFISGLPPERHAHEGVDGSEFISKPFHPRDVLDALARTRRFSAG